MDNLKVVSLFDGVSCGRLALERAGIGVSDYAAFEIDKYAISISRYNYPDIVQYGDVLTADFSMFKGFDMVMGGSPCTFWSIAKNNREIDKSGNGWKLFMSFANAVKRIRPKWFLYENVASMPTNIKDYITEELQVEPIMINSSLLSAQQRKRLYWTNIPNVERPQDRGILLKDILESGLPMTEKAYTMTATYNGAVIKNTLERKQRSMVGEPICVNSKSGRGGIDRLQPSVQNRIYSTDGKSTAITSAFMPNIAEPLVLNEKSQTILATLHKENALSMVKRNKTGLFCAYPLDKVLVPVKVGEIGRGGQGYRVYSVYGKTVCLSANGGGAGGKTGLYKIDLPDGNYIIRKLFPIEAERCQTITDGYTAFGIDTNGNVVPISNTQRYKCIGNGWTVDVIAYIFSHIK